MSLQPRCMPLTGDQTLDPLCSGQCSNDLATLARAELGLSAGWCPGPALLPGWERHFPGLPVGPGCIVLPGRQLGPQKAIPGASGSPASQLPWRGNRRGDTGSEALGVCVYRKVWGQPDPPRVYTAGACGNGRASPAVHTSKVFPRKMTSCFQRQRSFL